MSQSTFTRGRLNLFQVGYATTFFLDFVYEARPEQNCLVFVSPATHGTKVHLACQVFLFSFLLLFFLLFQLSIVYSYKRFLYSAPQSGPFLVRSIPGFLCWQTRSCHSSPTSSTFASGCLCKRSSHESDTHAQNGVSRCASTEDANWPSRSIVST